MGIRNLLKETPYSEVTATLEVLDHRGVSRENLGRIRSDSRYADRLAKFMLLGGIDESMPQKLARAIMGKNFWGVEEWLTFYSVTLTKRQQREIAEFPYGEDILNVPCPFHNGKSIKDTHFAFLGLEQIQGSPLTIVKWQEICPASGQLRFYHYADAWYANDKFANEPTCGFRWYLMPLEIIPDSTNKTFDQQKIMLPAEYEVPFAIEEVTKHILYYKKNDIYLNKTKYGRCQDTSSDGCRVGVGDSDPDGLVVSHYRDDHAYGSVGLASARKKVQSS